MSRQVNGNVVTGRALHIAAIDCCEHTLATLGRVPGSQLMSRSSREETLNKHNDAMDVIIVGVSRYPVRRLFISDLRRIYPNVPLLLLRREEAPQAPEQEAVHSADTGERIRGEFLLSDKSISDDYEIVRALREVLPIMPCSHTGKGDNYETVRRVMRVIGERYKDPRLNLENVANELPMSKVNLSRILNQQVGVTFRELLRSARIEEAKRMLASGRYSVKEVADRVGFVDSHYFSRSFKKLTGVSASDYRSQDAIFG